MTKPLFLLGLIALAGLTAIGLALYDIASNKKPYGNLSLGIFLLSLVVWYFVPTKSEWKNRKVRQKSQNIAEEKKRGS